MRDNYAYAYDDACDNQSNTLGRVLLIEDNKSDVQLIRRALQETHQPPLLLDTPRMIDALLLLDHAIFDLVLLDLNLVDSNGSASVAAVRAAAPGTPIIVYSGAQTNRLQEEALICGAARFLTKGHESLGELRCAIEQMLHRSTFTAQELL